MTNLTLLSVIGQTDPELTERAERSMKKKRLPWVFAAAACILLCAIVLPGVLRALRPAHADHTEPIEFETEDEMRAHLASAPNVQSLLLGLPDGAEVISERYLVTETEENGVTQIQIIRKIALDGKEYTHRLCLFFDRTPDQLQIDGYEEQGLRFEPIPGTEVKYSQLTEPAMTHAQAIFENSGAVYVLDLTAKEEDCRIREFVSALFH